MGSNCGYGPNLILKCSNGSRKGGIGYWTEGTSPDLFNVVVLLFLVWTRGGEGYGREMDGETGLGNELFYFCRLDLFGREVCRLASVQSDVLLQDETVGELFVTDRTLVEHSHWRFDPVDAHVRLEIAFGRESPSTDLAAKRPLSSVRPVVHLQCALAGQHPVADDTLVRIGQLVLDVIN